MTTAIQPYMKIELQRPNGENREITIPTYYDEARLLWFGVIQLPKSKRIITAHGLNSQELQDKFIAIVKHYLEDKKHSDEMFSLFKIVVKNDPI